MQAAIVSLAALAVAEPDASVVVPGVAVHPGLATSFEHRSPQGAPGLYGYNYGYPALAYGHFIGKREAEPSVVPGVAVHPGLATSFEHRSPQGAPGLPYAPYAPYYGVYGYGYF